MAMKNKVEKASSIALTSDQRQARLRVLILFYVA